MDSRRSRRRRSSNSRVVGGVVGVGVGAGLINYFNLGTILSPNFLIYLLFFLLFPFVNAFLDYFSLTFSRFLSKSIVKDSSFKKAVFHILLDGFFAILFLISLKFFLIEAINILNSYTKTEEFHIPIEHLINSIFQKGITLENAWVFFMLISTLIPTLFHFFVVIASLSNQKYLYSAIKEYEKSKNKTPLTRAAHFFALKTTLINSLYIVIGVLSLVFLIQLLIPFLKTLLPNLF